jgi:hypothetical protein
LIFDEALPRLLGIGWLEQVCLEVKQIEEDGKIPHPPAGLSSKSRTPLRKSDAEEKRIEQDGIEQDGTEEKVVRAVKPHSPSNGKQSEEDFLVELQANEAYQKLNVKQVYAKMKAWCSVRGKVATRRRLINWLNLEDQPMENSNGTYKPAGYQTAAERRDATFDRQLAVVNELRSRSSGTVDEVLCRKPG